MKNSSLIFFLMIVLISCSKRDTSNTVKPVLRDINESVYASVTVVPKSVYKVRPSQSGIVDSVYVKEGDLVIKGQALFKIRLNVEVSNRLKDAKITLEESTENYLGKNSLLKNLSEEIKLLETQLHLDSINLKRTEKLWSENIGTKKELDVAQQKYKASRSQLNSLKYKYNQTTATLKTQYIRSKNLVNTEQNRLKDYVVTSELEGRVFSISKEKGEFINPQEVFGEIGSDSLFIAELNIDEVDISKVSLGDTAVLSLEAYPNEVFVSKISYLSFKKDEFTQTFRAEAHLLTLPNKLFNGLSGEANILVATRKNALTIPVAYLTNGNKVITREKEIEVKLGVKNLYFVEVLEGLDTTANLILPQE